MADKVTITHHEPSIKDKIENALGDHCLDGKVTGYSTIEKTGNESSEDSSSNYGYSSESSSNSSSGDNELSLPKLIMDKEKITRMHPGIGYSYKTFLAKIARAMGNKPLETAILKEAERIKSAFFKNKASCYAMFSEHGISGFIYEELAKDYKAAANQYFLAGCVDYAVKICLDNKDTGEAIRHLKLAGRSKEAEKLSEKV